MSIIQNVLRAAREDILDALGISLEDGAPIQAEAGVGAILASFVERDLIARDFARILFIARRAEMVATAEGRSDLTQVLTKALDELEGKAPRMYVAVRDALLGGDVLMKRKYAQLEADHNKVREGAELVLRTAGRALTTGNVSPKLLLGSGDGTIDAEAIDGQLAEDVEQLRKLQLPRDPEQVADAEIEDENDLHKEPPFQESVERPRG